MKTGKLPLSVLLVVLCAFLAPVRTVAAEDMKMNELEAAIEEFAPITEGIYRGAQPSEEALTLLRDFGIRTVINFRHEKDIIAEERIRVEALGMDYVSLPWRIQKHPREPVMQQFLEVTDDKTRGPFFIHCRRGAERTGVADAVYRHLRLGQNRKAAWKDASEGHHLLWHWKPFTRKRYAEFLKNLNSPEA